MHWGYQINLIYINLFWLLRLWTWQSSHSRILFCHLKITNVKWDWSNTPFLNKCVIYFMQQVASWLLINRELYDSKFFIYDLKLLVRLIAFTTFGKIYKSFELPENNQFLLLYLSCISCILYIILNSLTRHFKSKSFLLGQSGNQRQRKIGTRMIKNKFKIRHLHFYWACSYIERYAID